jgi:hypothetical protein
MSLPCAHARHVFAVCSKQHARQRKFARQLLKVAHDNETLPDKVRTQRTSKKCRRKRPNTPHVKETLHGKGSGCCRGASFAVRAARLHDNVAFAVRFFSLPCANDNT